ncbi:hypothetical protein MSHOH_0742 [Methanosarcina horonobensis HB-1 = JCM 15518]|uniref:Uncharacterized protein n=1 Tax=Methanosarcina horonobensis HB-1 = JCM 15518 TaxID=1434110 RepID=A0A0E3WV61_9EURY|nr:hypothetical protein MSHOH_0742 [Methanosarcina horonobensis HB-1 = JCM 15518]
MESSPLFTGFIINVLCDPYSFTQPASFFFNLPMIQGELTCEGSKVFSSYLTSAAWILCLNLLKAEASA